MTASPLIPSTLARMRTGPPTFTPVTSPVAETDAIEASVEDQLIDLPETAIPLAVLGAAAS
jgi:hypothetical protein